MLLLRQFCILSVLVFCTESLLVQQANEEAVEDAIDKLFDGMRAADADMLKEVILDSATLQTVQGEELAATDMNRFVESVGQAEPGSLDERLDSMTIHVDGNLATAWMDYRFYYNGEFSHCGVNSMNLLKTSSGWKIFSIVDTRRQEGCGEN